MRTGGTSTTAAERSGNPTLTLGVEEEFLLLDRSDGHPVDRAQAVLTLLGGDPRVKYEFLRCQLETVTGVCTDLEQVGQELAWTRRLVADAATRLDCHLVATGMALQDGPGLCPVTADPRYLQLVARYGSLAAGPGTCACHVHVGISSRELGVRVLARLRPYLATLLALSANSPVADGRDTGWASCRYLRWIRWPSAVPPQVWRSAGDYDAAVRRVILRGDALDERGVYFHARLSPRYPTVELRIMDACLTVEDTLLIAGLARALVALAIDDDRRGVPIKAISSRRIAAELRAAAWHGLDAHAVDPYSGRTVPHRLLLDGVLNRLPEPEPIARLLHCLARRGTGADRQHAMWAQAGTPQRFAQFLADATLR
ncbi:YbdK family carboxylate-amine ligase [Nonomuraea sp. NPDC026600]|uniref:carboxylate-amine ligase n=1 Tax=Nonomuraea sp. NPDC026600 TaxID=3155363 RepID=UPI0033E26E37